MHLKTKQIVAVHGFTQESQIDEAVSKLEHLYEAITQREPHSAEISFKTARLFSRICCRRQRALHICRDLMEQALRADSSDSLYHCELGHVLTLLGEYGGAVKHFKDASKRSQSFVALEGMILCQLYEGQLDDAEAQIELLTVMHESEGDSEDALSPEFAFLQALLSLRKRRDLRSHLAKLDECQRLFFARVTQTLKRSQSEPLNELVISDPDFLLQVC
jgi:lipopolysaccharide biosynthesis regulator YciM